MELRESPAKRGGVEMHSILTPTLALVVLSLHVWIWMYATRIPAMQRADLQPQDAKFPADLQRLPDSARQVADNYNHLMEQPTIFYALVFYIFLMGHTDQLHIYLAWIYVVIRVAHTLIQCTTNIVRLRFSVFALSTIVLMVMAVREIAILL
jgi:hypothetical protein